VTEAYEQRLWEELNDLLADKVPEGATQRQADDAILFAVLGRDDQAGELYRQVRALAKRQAGYLRERMEEDNPVAAVHRRLYGP
jgi:hypothetical protein